MLSSVWIVPLVAVALAQIAVIATSVYLHRALSHRALRVHPVAELLFRAVLWLTTGLGRREWVAVHRKHHTFTDRDGDPHSPRLFGFWHVQLFNVYYYMRAAQNRETIETFAPDLPEDWLDRTVFAWGWCGPALGLVGLCVILGVGAGLGAGLGHALLYVFVLAPLIKKFSVGRGEFDPSWLVIRALAVVRLVALARVAATRVPPQRGGAAQSDAATERDEGRARAGSGG